MNIDPKTYRSLCHIATWAFAIAVVALWVPFAGQADPSALGTQVLHLDFGVLAPLRVTWQSSAAGFWLAISDVRVLALGLSAILTIASVIAARTTYRLSQTTA